MSQIYQDNVTNIVCLSIHIHGDWRKNEYSTNVKSFIGALDIDSPNGLDDPYLINQAVIENGEEIFEDEKEGANIDVVLTKTFDADAGANTASTWYELAYVARMGQPR